MRVTIVYSVTRHTAKPGLGPVQSPDLRKTRTRHSDLPSKKVGLVHKTRTRSIQKLNSKLDSFYTRFQNYATEKNLVANVSFMKRTAINGNDERNYIF